HPDLGRPIKENIPAEHSRSAGRAGVLKIDCLPNDPAPICYNLASSGSEREPKIASLKWNKRDVAPRTQRHVRAERISRPLARSKRHRDKIGKIPAVFLRDR